MSVFIYKLFSLQECRAGILTQHSCSLLSCFQDRFRPEWASVLAAPFPHRCSRHSSRSPRRPPRMWVSLVRSRSARAPPSPLALSRSSRAAQHLRVSDLRALSMEFPVAPRRPQAPNPIHRALPRSTSNSNRCANAEVLSLKLDTHL